MIGRSSIVAALVLLTLSASARGEGLSFRVVDADSGRELSDVSVRIRAFRHRSVFPYLWPNSGYIEIRDQKVQTDSAGSASFPNIQGDEWFEFETPGFVSTRAFKSWFRYRISADPYEKSDPAPVSNGVVLVVLKKKPLTAALKQPGEGRDAARRAGEPERLPSFRSVGPID
jgi:hypothetical protein